MPVTITEVLARDIRFPTSVTLDGSDALNREPDYSAAYVVLRTDAGDGLEGHGLTFTTGRGNELCVAAVKSLSHLVAGRTLEDIAADLGAFWSSLVDDGQLRWVDPRRASSTSRRPRSSTPCGTCLPSGRASRCGGSSRT